MKLGDALAFVAYSAIAGSCVGYLYTSCAVRSDHHLSVSSLSAGRAASLSSGSVADSDSLVRSSPESVMRADLEGSSWPEGCVTQSVSEPDRNDEALGNSPGQAGQRSPLVFASPIVQQFQNDHPNSPLRFVPADASTQELSYLEQQLETILDDWKAERDRLFEANDGNLLSFCADQRTLANDKNRQSKMKDLVKSLWPESGK